MNGDAFLGDVLIGRLDKDAEVVTPGPHAWDGSYTELTVEWKRHKWRVESAHDSGDLVMLVTPLESKDASALPPTVVFSVGTAWNSSGGPSGHAGYGIVANTGVDSAIEIDCTCWNRPAEPKGALPVTTPYFAVDLTAPAG